MACDVKSIAYINWFRDNPEFPRKVLVIKEKKDESFKYTIKNELDYLEYLRRENNTNCYCQIFSNRQIAEATFDTMYLDIDVHEEFDEEKKPITYETRVKNAYDIFIKVRDAIIKAGYKVSRAYFTGRGFAVYVDFERTKFNTRSGYRFAVRTFLMEIDVFRLLDPSVLGDVERVARLPNTENGNAKGMHCVQIDPQWDLDRIVYASRTGVGFDGVVEKDSKFADRLKEIETNGNGLFNSVEGQDIERTPLYGEHTKYENFPKCMQGFYNEIVGTGELDHYERINLAIFLMRIWGYDKAKRILSWAGDYKEHKTDYNMRYLMSKNMRVYACKKMKQSFTKKGNCWCPYDKMWHCPAYRLSKGWIEKILPNFKKEDLNRY